MQRFKVLLLFGAADASTALALWAVWGWPYALTSFLAPVLAMIVFAAFIFGKGSIHSLFGLIGTTVAYGTTTLVWIAGLWSWGGPGFAVAYVGGLTVPAVVFVFLATPELEDTDRKKHRQRIADGRWWWT